METIRILIYTDSPDISENPDLGSWGITELKKLINLKLNGIVEVVIDLLNRHEWDPVKKQEINGANKITQCLLEKYHEIWILGFRQVNLPNSEPPELNNELEDGERDVLKAWMDTGGVLITGDHSEFDQRNPNGSCQDDHSTFLNLGRALGKRIRRAGQLRVWEGPPTNCSTMPLNNSDMYNTQEGNDPCVLDSLTFQRDEFPQTLTLTDPCNPHTLFRKPSTQKKFTPITKFPDHAHEGRLRIPEHLDCEWPENSPNPLVIARGSDKRFPEEKRIYDLVVAYDGHSAEVGRIVADSSFHHYLNVNLSSIPARDSNGLPQPDTPLDDIAQYYGNLAYWLAPKKLRERVKGDLLFRLSKHPDVLQVKGNSAFLIGKTARSVLDNEIGLSRISLLLQSSDFEAPPSLSDHILSYLLLENTSLPQSFFFNPESILGGIVNWYRLHLSQLGFGRLGWLRTSPLEPDAIIKQFLQIQMKSDRRWSTFLDFFE